MTTGLAHSHGVVPAASRAERKVWFDPADFAVPTGREEEWRFTPLARLRPLVEDGPADGRLTWGAASLPAGVTLGEVGADGGVSRSVRAPGDRAAALAVRDSGGATILAVAPWAVVAEPVEIAAGATGANTKGHLVIEVGAEASATLILDYTGGAVAGEFVSVDVADDASLSLVILHNLAPEAVHVTEWVVRVGRRARLHAATATLGGGLVRVCTSVALAGEDSEANLFGVYFANSGQHLEHRTFVDHASPRCRSRVTYKGALAGVTAHTVWVGDVLIRAEAEGTDTYELNRNLLLTDGTRADSVPNLEMTTGEIAGAGHASATGRFDDEQMFYLRSRGIPEFEARRLVVRGFFADVIHEMGVPRIEEELMRAIETRLEAVDG